MKPEVEQKVADRRAERNAKAIENVRRFKAMDINICPDCGGDLVSGSSVLRRTFLSTQYLDCSKCGIRHEYWELDW